MYEKAQIVGYIIYVKTSSDQTVDEGRKLDAVPNVQSAWPITIDGVRYWKIEYMAIYPDGLLAVEAQIDKALGRVQQPDPQPSAPSEGASFETAYVWDDERRNWYRKDAAHDTDTTR